MRTTVKTLRPSSAITPTEIKVDQESDEETDNPLLPMNEMSFVRLKGILKKKEGSEEVEKTIPKVLVENLLEPRFNLDVASMSVVKFRTDLLKNLSLQLRGNFLLGQKDKSFSEELLNDSGQQSQFREYVMKHGGYLVNESNYFQIDPKRLSEMSKATMLINSRVLLFWRGITLGELAVKKILTAGLGFLVGSISYAELLVIVQSHVPKGTFEVSVKYQTNAYVLIGIEAPVFQR